MSVHVLWSRGYYIGQVRMRGFKKWETVTGRCRSMNPAMSRAVANMSIHHNRARVLFVDTTGWYEPNICMEASRT